MKNLDLFFLLFGIFMLIVSFIANIGPIMEGRFPSNIMTFSLAIMGFSLAYLSPQFAAKDERAQKIRERAIYISYFWVLSFSLLLLLALNVLPAFSMNAIDLLTLLLAFHISIVFINMVYYARKY